MASENKTQNSTTKPLRLVYIVGRYPELTTTFIEREINTLSQLDDIEVQVISIRYPLTLKAVSSDYQPILDSAIYLVPESWMDFNWLAFIIANLRFIFLRPIVYFSTFFYLLLGSHPGIKHRLMTIFHFWQGVYAAEILRGLDFGHLHAHFIDRAVVVALVAGRLLNKNYSLTAHANSIFAKTILIREKIVNASFVVTVSEYNKQYLLNTYSGIDPEKIFVLHPWVNVSHFTPSDTQKIHQRLRILSVGRLVEKKGHIYLIKACHLLQEQGVDFECCIVGGGPLQSSLEKDIARYGLQDQVNLTGGVPPSEVLDLLNDWADVFALPCVIASDGDRDGIPVSLAEAMAMELPVISTDIVGISELVKPGTGILTPPHNAAAVAEALQAIDAAGAEARVEMGRQGRGVVDGEFNLQKGASQLADLFRRVAL